MYKRGQKSEHVSILELYGMYVVQQVKIVTLHKSHPKPKIGKKKKKLFSSRPAHYSQFIITLEFASFIARAVLPANLTIFAESYSVGSYYNQNCHFI